MPLYSLSDSLCEALSDLMQTDDEAAMLEEKPGIAPSAMHLKRVNNKVSIKNTMAILRTTFDDSAPSKWLMEKSGVPAIVLPFSVPRTPKEGSLAALFNEILTKLENIAVRP